MAKAIHPKLAGVEMMLDVLTLAAREAGLQTGRWVRELRRKRYRVLQPGLDTPLWNELRRRVAEQISKRGDQATLARYLGISRQRLHLMIKANAAAPDAERTLLLLAWVLAREEGRDLR